jgi:mRNA-degrading endonuclease YafQ of YafQ-DinJ toxin-antitoxin module
MLPPTLGVSSLTWAAPRGGLFLVPQKRGQHRNLDEALANVVQLLADDTPFPSATAIMPFPATGQATGNATSGPTSCLIYRKPEGTLQLIRLGSPSELFS